LLIPNNRHLYLILDHVLEIANRFVNSLSESSPNLNYTIGTPEVFCTLYYFDFIVPDENPAELPSGGAPGFVVDKDDLTTRIIAHWELNELRRINELVNTVAKEIMQGRGNLARHKNLLHITASDYLKLEKTLHADINEGQKQLFELLKNDTNKN
jgi:hypothetical protein